MAIDEKRLLDIMINKFNAEYGANHNPENFLIYPITANINHQFGYEAKTTLLGSSSIRLRAYFNFGPIENLHKFKLSPIDDADPAEDYAFVTKGVISRDIVTAAPTMASDGTYDGSGTIDPTSVCVDVSMALGQDEW